MTEYKTFTGKSEFWKEVRREENLRNAFSQGEFKTFEMMSKRDRDNDGKDSTGSPPPDSY